MQAESGLGLELIKILPQLAWVGLAFLVVLRHAPDLIPRLKHIRAGKLEIGLAEQALDAAVNHANEHDVTLAEKDQQWKVQVPPAAKQRVMARAKRRAEVLHGGRILWLDDRPENNNNESTMFTKLGLTVDTARSSEQAFAALQAGGYDLILSDMDRDGDSQAGLGFLAEYQQPPGEKLPVIFYLGDFDPAKGKPGAAFGLTNRPDELLNLVIDVMDRKSVD